MDIIKIIIIIAIVILILIIYLTNIKNKYNEEFRIDDNTNSNLSTASSNFMNNQIYNYPNIQITNSLNIKDVEFKKYINNKKYPVGCYYIQYPDSKVNEDKKKKLTPFPDNNSPGNLFGGEWVIQYNTESIFFRSTNIIKSADNISLDERKKGLQNYKQIKLAGATAWAQSSNGDFPIPPEEPQKTLPFNAKINPKCVDKPKSRLAMIGVAIGVAFASLFTFGAAAIMYAGTYAAITAAAATTEGALRLDKSGYCPRWRGPAIGAGYSGAFSFIDNDPKYKKRINTDGGGGSTMGVSYILDTAYVIPNNLSEKELRVNNRLIRVWKRIK